MGSVEKQLSNPICRACIKKRDYFVKSPPGTVLDRIPCSAFIMNMYNGNDILPPIEFMCDPFPPKECPFILEHILK